MPGVGQGSAVGSHTWRTMVSHLLSVVNCVDKLNEGSTGIRRAATASISRSVPCKSAHERKLTFLPHPSSPFLFNFTFTFKFSLYRTTGYYKTTTDLVTCAGRYHYLIFNLPYSILLISIIGVRSIHNPTPDGGRAHHWSDTAAARQSPHLQSSLAVSLPQPASLQTRPSCYRDLPPAHCVGFSLFLSHSRFSQFSERAETSSLVIFQYNPTFYLHTTKRGPCLSLSLCYPLEHTQSSVHNSRSSSAVHSASSRYSTEQQHRTA
ncbi:hypothetical protein F4679DRAFT_463355 [Xylaria curta]|nr:hypothetical protein F4679DRAFT_463355 [Xylaria curta]